MGLCLGYLVLLLAVYGYHASVIREYYIAAEEAVWDYVPMRWNQYLNQSLESSARFLVESESQVGSVYAKAFYRQYSDASFRSLIPHDPSLGVLGPILRAEAGDTVKIHFLNRARYSHSLFPYTTRPSRFRLPGQSVGPGEEYMYEWHLPIDTVFPENQSSFVTVYVSKAEPVLDIHAGLLGVLVVYRPGELEFPSPGAMFQRPKGIDREVFAFMSITDEYQSRYLHQTVARLGGSQATLATLKKDPRFRHSLQQFHINGYLYNNNPPVLLDWGSRVRWYVISLGLTVQDIHTAHWHGATLLYHGHRMDVLDMTPISFEVVDMVPDNEGTWLFHCHVASHLDMGMTMLYEVQKLIITGDEGW
ncbi:Cupredoxin [Sporodiniella umbellata]|nr:Cupredoxin [Sporodiniella umbellata]